MRCCVWIAGGDAMNLSVPISYPEDTTEMQRIESEEFREMLTTCNLAAAWLVYLIEKHALVAGSVTCSGLVSPCARLGYT